MTQSPIQLSTFSACTSEYDSLERIFEAWLTPPAKVALFPDHSDESIAWKSLVETVMKAVPCGEKNGGDCGFILATTKGNIAALEAWMNAADAGDDTLGPLMSESTRALADRFHLDGPRFCVSAACASGLVGLIEAAMMVREGDAPRMLVCGADIAGQFVRDGFASLKAISSTVCRPFDIRRDGLALGSAAAACLVHQADDNRANQGGDPVVLLAGWGISVDAVHITAPDRQAGGLIRAVEQALALAGVCAEQIDAVLLHGTGTLYNDAMEATAMRRLFPHQPPLTAVKGLIGHTLGASGLLETALAGRMLHRQVVPPITGLEISQYPDLQLVRGEPLLRPLHRVLKTASGFGGINAAVVLALVGAAGI